MDITLPRARRPKSRRSIAHLPQNDGSGEEKENITADTSSFQRSRSVENRDKVDKKKARGKSLGPGGIEALKENTNNAAQSAIFQPRSILKPSIPLTPPKAIPSFDELKKRSTGKDKSPAKNGAEDLLIDFSTPGPTNTLARVSVTGSENVADPFSPITRKSPREHTATLRREQEQADATREREAEEQRLAQKQAALAQRAARRKSMANRRVSFAPEATLHTWNVVEIAEDSTTSSASNSTRRQSSMTAAQSPYPVQSPIPQAEALQTPMEQMEPPMPEASPINQHELHQKKRRRRSSTVPHMDIERSPDSGFSSSPTDGSSVTDAETSPVRIEDSIHSSSDEDDTEADGDTAMSIGDATSQTVGSDQSGSSTRSSLDERLRRAASMAGTRGIEYDEHGDDLPMEMVTGTITNAFQPWVGRQQPSPEQERTAMQDQENVNPFSTAFYPEAAVKGGSAESMDSNEEMTMDVTRSVGGILSGQASPGKGRRKSVASSRRRSSMARRRSLADDSDAGEETMDFTTVGGGIIQRADQEENESTGTSDEDLSMDFTNVIGGVLNRNMPTRRESVQSMITDDNETMDMTAAMGGILGTVEERTEPQTEGERTAPMDMTVAIGAILPTSLGTKDKMQARQLMEDEVDVGQLSGSSHELTDRHSLPTKSTLATPSHVHTSVASETGSPSLTLKPRTSGRQKSLDASHTPTSSTTPKHMTPTKSSTLKQITPTKQVTPLPARSATPNKTPLSANVTHRGASPKKLFRREIKARASPGSTKAVMSAKKPRLFERDEHTGHQTPSVVLHAPKPHQHLHRRSSGIGIDQEGLGSPCVAELLDRRASIGEAAPVFTFGGQEKRSLRFENPKVMEEEVDAERAEEERRESGRFVMEREADVFQEENATIQLKEMIELMSPKKSKISKLKGRKSLAVGAARGVLGKRPAELDMDDEDESDLTPKRLKVVEREASPVKKVKLPQPPSKDETTGRLTRAQRQELEDLALTSNITPTLIQSPGKVYAAGTPQPHGRFRDAPFNTAADRPSSFEDRMDNVMDAVDISTAQMEKDQYEDADGERISLQSFLNMTNIHFIELSTTKRRHTMAASGPCRPSDENFQQMSSLDACFSAAATTLPLLELYQHATRELKTYISTGRKIIRSIEAETLKEQPQLFREYMDARPDIKVVMDNQFRNGKTNARLQSREGWYAWRGQLVDGLRGGLEGIKKGMQEDAERLETQEAILGNALPGLITKHAELEHQLSAVEQRVTEYDSIDHEALRQSRRQLQSADDELEAKTAQLEALQVQMHDKAETLNAAAELKVEVQEQISEAERVHEECRGWAGKDVRALKSKVDEIERTSGWKLIAAEEDADEPNGFGVAITMTYKDELRLFFHPAAFQERQSGRRRSSRKSRSVSGPNAPISLNFSPKDEDTATQPELSTERRFFLQLIRSQLHAFAMMPRGSVSATSLLSTVARGWELAEKVSKEVRLLNVAGIVVTSILGDERVGASLMLMLNGSRVNVDFALTVTIDADGVFQTSCIVSAKAAYGNVEDLLSTPGKSRKVQTALAKEIGSRELGSGAWVGSIKGLEQWVEAQLQARQQQQPVATPVPAPQPAAPKFAPRSPLAPKSVNRVQKRSIPIPQKVRMQAQPVQQQQEEPEMNKENVTPQKSRLRGGDDMELKMGRPAIPPEMQEEMMHTPIKRVGALRRSPIIG